jgi:hypothetical protein
MLFGNLYVEDDGWDNGVSMTDGRVLMTDGSDISVVSTTIKSFGRQHTQPRRETHHVRR